MVVCPRTCISIRRRNSISGGHFSSPGPGVGFCLLEHTPGGPGGGTPAPEWNQDPLGVLFGDPLLDVILIPGNLFQRAAATCPLVVVFSRPVLLLRLVCRSCHPSSDILVVYLSQQVLVFLSVVLILSYLIGTMDGLENDFAIPPSFWGMSIPSSSSGSFTSCDQEEGFTTQVSNVCICRAW